MEPGSRQAGAACGVRDSPEGSCACACAEPRSAEPVRGPQPDRGRGGGHAQAGARRAQAARARAGGRARAVARAGASPAPRLSAGPARRVPAERGERKLCLPAPEAVCMLPSVQHTGGLHDLGCLLAMHSASAPCCGVPGTQCCQVAAGLDSLEFPDDSASLPRRSAALHVAMRLPPHRRQHIPSPFGDGMSGRAVRGAAFGGLPHCRSPHVRPAAQAYQKVVTGAVLLSTLVNLGTLLSVSACGAAATASFAGAGLSAVLLLFNWLKARPRAPAQGCPPRPALRPGLGLALEVQDPGFPRLCCGNDASLAAVHAGAASYLGMPAGACSFPLTNLKVSCV